ncbi:hypothetical protein B0T26DRAFT_125387 [Lasiosphaeria miniovina]|uniref:Uncharacterized protein n=1 Tax=Lasiosphaeria miniovina TaxID=1954250 RepID=A0AA40B3Z0_9PEZI|nr:uncharacterized protein B0T26DRAFT_125387 [Lasiosphaeria miniovina]KAK0727259.1 hypothetical protein B0T26DRAFT_125387 [Lasiosphaeria miniovina]
MSDLILSLTCRFWPSFWSSVEASIVLIGLGESADQVWQTTMSLRLLDTCILIPSDSAGYSTLGLQPSSGIGQPRAFGCPKSPF